MSRNEGNWDVKLLVLRTNHSKPEATASKFMNYTTGMQGCAEVPTDPTLSVDVTDFFSTSVVGAQLKQTFLKIKPTSTA